MTNCWRILAFLLTFLTCNYLSHTADFGHLPTALRPKLYKIYLEPNFENGTIRGRVDIQIDVRNITDKIFLHYRNLTIMSTQLSIKDGPPLKVREIEYYPENETMIIILEEVLRMPGEFHLEIDYNGLIQNDEMGFYNSSYLDDEGNLK